MFCFVSLLLYTSVFDSVSADGQMTTLCNSCTCSYHVAYDVYMINDNETIMFLSLAMSEARVADRPRKI